MRILILTTILLLGFPATSESREEAEWSYYVAIDELTGELDYTREKVLKSIAMLNPEGKQVYIGITYWCPSGYINLSFSEEFRKDHPIRLKFDGELNAFTKWPLLEENYSGQKDTTVFLYRPPDWKQLLKKHNELRVEITPRKGIPFIVVFSLKGFSARVAQCQREYHQ